MVKVELSDGEALGSSGRIPEDGKGSPPLPAPWHAEHTWHVEPQATLCGCAPARTDPPEEEQHGLGEGLEVVVPVDLRRVIQGDFPKDLAGGGDGAQ